MPYKIMLFLSIFFLNTATLIALEDYEEKQNTISQALQLQETGAYHKAINIWQTLNNKEPDEAFYYYNLGFCNYYLGNFTEAKKNYQTALTLYKQYNNLQYTALVLKNLSLLEAKKGNNNKATTYILQAIDTFKTTNDKLEEAYSLIILAEIYENKKQLKQTYYYLQESKNILSQIGEVHIQKFIELKIAKNLIKTNKISEAEEYINNIINYAQKNNLNSLLAEAYLELAKIKEDQFRLSEEYYLKALDYYKKDYNTNYIIQTLHSLSNLLQKYHHTDTAKNYLLESLAEAKKNNLKQQETLSLIYLADLNIKISNHEETNKYLQEALTCAQLFKDQYLEPIILSKLANVALKKKDTENTLYYFEELLSFKEKHNSLEQIDELKINIYLLKAELKKETFEKEKLKKEKK